eukprot:scaffold41745_cov176-Amphora_coffeaeformis.AAC.6
MLNIGELVDGLKDRPDLSDDRRSLPQRDQILVTKRTYFMKRPSSAKCLRRYLLLLLFTIYHLATAFIPAPTKTYSSVLTKNVFPAKDLPPLMAFKPHAFLNDSMKFAGPMATIGLTLPQLQDLSMKNIQRVGETSLAAMLFVAAVQGALIMHQYATNPAGELIVPPGLTLGTEDASQITEGANIDPCGVATRGEKRQQMMDSLQNIENLVCNRNDESIQANMKRGWYHVNRLLVLLVPLAVEQFGFAALQYSHMMHLAVIMGLVHIFDFFQRLPDTREEIAISDEPEFGENPHIVVLGDSMAVGIGCVNEFDPDKNSGILRRIEQVEADPEQKEGFGPVFPRMLARTLSRRLKRSVTWRSAGVDGGDTNQIRQFLLPVIQEEVDKGIPPDVVVVLTGSNDLKHIIQTDSETGGRASIRGFRANLMTIVQEIHAISPQTRVVFPALPTYRLDANSVLNIFPLSLFLDGLISFWDAQKIHVANQCPGVMHVDLKLKDVYKWYAEESGHGSEEPTLLSADGIHPNAKCYSKWGSFVGNAIADKIIETQHMGQTPQPRPAYLSRRMGWASSH